MNSDRMTIPFQTEKGISMQQYEGMIDAVK